MLRQILSAAAIAAAGATAFTARAQSLPNEWSYSADGHMILIGKQAPTGLYDSSLIRTLNLQFASANYWSQLTANHATGADLQADLTIDGTLYDSVGVRFKGQTSYNTPNKKSFNITVDYANPDADAMGYTTLNLNNAYEDPSFLREVMYLHQIRQYIPAAKANFVHLTLNGADWGLYPNVQQMNKKYLKQWYLSNDGAHWRADAPTTGGPGGPGGPGGGPGWGDGTAALNYLGTDTALYQQYYTLKSSDVANPWTLLQQVTDKLENTSIANLETALPQYLDIDRTLWFLACEIAFADDDSYVYKGKMDYYVYYEPETGRFVPHEYDGNSAFYTDGASWGAFYHADNDNYPLLYRMMQVPAWRQRYLAHLRTIIAQSLNVTASNAMIDNYKAQIDALVNSDPKKIYTYAQFTSEITALKNFVSTRRTNLLANSEVAQVAPAIAQASHAAPSGAAWSVPALGQGANVTAKATATSGIYGVKLYYSTELVGNFTAVTMYDDGVHNDTAAGDGIYGAAIPAQDPGTWVRWYVEATANNIAKSVSYLPVGAEHDVFYYISAPAVATNKPVAINEVMASNATSAADNAGEFDDWIELYNKTAAPVDISGWYLTDNAANPDKWAVAAGTTIPANGYLIIWADEDSSQGNTHANFKLSASEGEWIMLSNANKELVDSMRFGVQQEDKGFARIPNGTGLFVIQGPTFGYNNELASGVSAVGAQDALYTLYPNPADGMLNVTILQPASGALLELRSALGQLVYAAEGQNSNRISTASLANGIYFLRYGGVTRRVVVKH